MTPHPLPIFVQRFFTERLANQLAASTNTVASYRDTFRLLLTFATACRGRQPTDFLVTDIDADLVGRFLDSVETSRGNSARTRNTRLAAIRSFFKYVAINEPGLLHHCQRVITLPSKRHEKRMIDYLDREQIEALLAAPDLSTWYGRRDRALLQLCADRAQGLRTDQSPLRRCRSRHGRPCPVPRQGAQGSLDTTQGRHGDGTRRLARRAVRHRRPAIVRQQPKWPSQS